MSFAEGVRPDEKQLWKQEWLEMSVDSELCINSSEYSSAGGEVKVDRHRFESTRKWQEDVSVQVESDLD